MGLFSRQSKKEWLEEFLRGITVLIPPTPGKSHALEYREGELHIIIRSRGAEECPSLKAFDGPALQLAIAFAAKYRKWLEVQR